MKFESKFLVTDFIKGFAEINQNGISLLFLVDGKCFELARYETHI